MGGVIMLDCTQTSCMKKENLDFLIKFYFLSLKIVKFSFFNAIKIFFNIF